MTIYERIKGLCKERKISVNKLEERLGISKGSLCRIDVNKPSAEKINNLAEFFGVTAEFLTTGKESGENASESFLNIEKGNKKMELCKNMYFSMRNGISDGTLTEEDLLSINAIIDRFIERSQNDK